MALKYFIFDLDGTLIDTEQAILKTWQQTLKEYGYIYSIDEIRCVLGVTAEIGLHRLGSIVDSDYTKKWQINYSQYAKEADYFKGTKEMLMLLKEKGCSVGAVSSRCRKEYADFFSGFEFESIFDEVILEEDTTRHKPEPEPLYKYMELVGANKTECIYIGDMPSDIQCANNAGIVSGLVTWNGAGVVCDEATMIFNSIEDVLALA
jgi:HAD superfamily hydrolase (TIGR01549 family)